MARRQPDPHLQHVLYGKLIAGTHHLPTVARRGGLSYELLSKLCRGERHLLAEHLPRLYRGTQDLELFAELSGANLCDLVITERADEADDSSEATSSAALHVGARAGNVQQLVAQADADGLLTEVEASAIETAIDELERKAATLRQVLRARRVRVVGSER